MRIGTMHLGLIGGADPALAFTERNTPFPIVDCAAVDVGATVRGAIP